MPFDRFALRIRRVTLGITDGTYSWRRALSLLVLAAMLTVYVVLGILYESYTHPLTILSTLPSAGIGAFMALLAFHTELGIIAYIGLILLEREKKIFLESDSPFQSHYYS